MYMITPEGLVSPFLIICSSLWYCFLFLEVSAGVRLCDGCLLLVDAVEGVCSQTSAALQQALTEGVVPLLVLTKLDRLITTLQLSPQEAFAKCQAIIEQV